jgi:hypothetical protein
MGRHMGFRAARRRMKGAGCWVGEGGPPLRRCSSVLGHLSPALRSRWSTPFSRQPRARERVVRRSRTGGPPLGSRWSAPREQVVRPFRAHHPRPDHPSGARESTSEARKRAAGAREATSEAPPRAARARESTSEAPMRAEVAGKSAFEAPVSAADAQEAASEARTSCTRGATVPLLVGRPRRIGHCLAVDPSMMASSAASSAGTLLDATSQTMPSSMPKYAWARMSRSPAIFRHSISG